MLSLLGSLLGFGASALPKVMGYFQNKMDNAHEILLMGKQLESQLQLQKAGAEMRLAEVNVDADIRETEMLHKEQIKITLKASQWCVNLSSSVRPIISYLFFGELVFLTVAVYMDWVSMEEYNMIWNNEMQAVFAAVVSFWFGSRSFNRK